MERLPAVTLEQLTASPELAALEILDATLATATRALIAANPELLSPDFLSEGEVTPQSCLGGAVLSSIAALGEALNRYCVHLNQVEQRREQAADRNTF